MPLKRRAFAHNKVTSITPALTSLMAKSDELKTTAQAAFVSYIRSVFLHANKAVFDVSKLDVEAFAESFGLPTVPRVRMIQKLRKQAGRSSAGKRSGDAADAGTAANAPAAHAERLDEQGAGQDHDRDSDTAAMSDGGGSGDDSELDGDADDAGVAAARQSAGNGASGRHVEDEQEDELFAIKRADVLQEPGAAGAARCDPARWTRCDWRSSNCSHFGRDRSRLS